MIPSQFEYLGKWVDTKHFCAFVYSATDQRLAKNYQSFIDLVGSGLWFPTKEEAQKAILKVADSTPLEIEAPKSTRESTKNKLRMINNPGK